MAYVLGNDVGDAIPDAFAADGSGRVAGMKSPSPARTC